MYNSIMLCQKEVDSMVFIIAIDTA